VKKPGTWQPFFPPGTGVKLRRRPAWTVRHREQLRYGAAFSLIGAALALAIVNARAAPPSAPASQQSATAGVAAQPSWHEYTVVRIPDPTPIFATYRDLAIHLPIRPDKITLIAFHQAAGSQQFLHMKSIIEPTKPKSAPSAASTGVPESAEIAYAEDAPAPTVYAGRFIRLWRSGRSGFPDSAADVGAKVGTTVYSPVSGTVLGVRGYELYGRYPDIEIHIMPTGHPELDVVLLHTYDPSVRAGEEVTAGVTPLSKVRWLSRLLDNQLGEFTHEGGNHVHVQLIRLKVPGEMPKIAGTTWDPLAGGNVRSKTTSP
jgi:hypothetical protein